LSILSIISDVKEGTIDNLVCPAIHRLGVQTIPAASLLMGEIALSCILQQGVILPSPIGVELMEFPLKMIYILKGRNTIASYLTKIRERYLGVHVACQQHLP
jgi:hypothetical protein